MASFNSIGMIKLISNANGTPVIKKHCQNIAIS